jgi:hypothetical protein
MTAREAAEQAARKLVTTIYLHEMNAGTMADIILSALDKAGIACVDKELLSSFAEILEVAELHWDEGPDGEGWQSVGLKEKIAKAHRLLSASKEEAKG